MGPHITHSPDIVPPIVEKAMGSSSSSSMELQLSWTSCGTCGGVVRSRTAASSELNLRDSIDSSLSLGVISGSLSLGCPSPWGGIS